MSRTSARLGALTLSTALVLVAAPAGAHITVSSPDAAQEGYGKLVFRVPNESEAASTDRLTITLPADTPLSSVSAGVKPGWEVEVEEAELPEPVESGDLTLTEAVRTVTWTATGEGIAPGQFDEFSLSGGPMPAVDELVLEAEQAYDDGEVVDWADVAEGDEEPERPAPVLELPASTGDAHGAHAGEESEEAADDTGASSDGPARGLGALALLLAAGALVVALRQNRRRA